ncbi:MAG: BREX-2 system adenine-specific DNA-methyltransferase PglX [bacterium]|nr:BREX-2 system adenine-specific DNA-methyltransferase PglX [bacterium]
MYLPELKRLVVELSEDLLTRSSLLDVDQGLREAYTQIEKGGRTADAFEVWREDYLDQVAVAWVLGCVFVRFMEDNHLIDECWLAGDGDRRKLAEDTHELYFREHPHESDREYFEFVFHEVGKIPACRDLFAEGKTPLWAVGPSGDMAIRLLAFWREIDAETGRLARSFEVEDGDTRFLGDLYQDLSERARKKYALLQTPVFVEEFILDRTLDPAIDEFGLDEVRMIDPTCGSGHFLLGGFARLFDLWIKREANEVVAAQKALDGVWGCDINPFAVAIARFRLIVAALRVCGIKRLKNAPAWNIHLATGDSLLFGGRWDQEGKKKGEQQFFETDEESWAPEIYACEDKEAISEVLGQQYHAVVGNPPYIIVKDKKLNQAYRQRYSTCHQKYSLSVPFAERFFDLAVHGQNDRVGFVGQITANSFMKREFGKKLIEAFFPRIDLTHVIDTSGAYIPGHGTPTVILFGRSRSPSGQSVRALLGINGEPGTPTDPSSGKVWTSILSQIDSKGTEDQFISSDDAPRSTFNAHPWSLGGGGASDLKEFLDNSFAERLKDRVSDIGFMAISGEDDCFAAQQHILKRNGVPYRPFCLGEGVRDWGIEPEGCIVFPYEESDNRLPALTGNAAKPVEQYFWPVRVSLRSRSMFGKTPSEHGLKWYEYMQFIRHRASASLSIAFAFVSTHNHYVLDRGRKVFKQSAPIITLNDPATIDDHFHVLGLLNSSVACFWMKQVFHNKGDSTDQYGARTTGVPEFNTYEFTGTGLQNLPMASESPHDIAHQLDELATEYQRLLPHHLITDATPSESVLESARNTASSIRAKMISLQEELDWRAYRSYGLIEDDLCFQGDVLPASHPGSRAFEIVLARQLKSGDSDTKWFERHGVVPITEVPSSWPEEYRLLVERRIEAIASNKFIRLIENGVYKRRWAGDSWGSQEAAALRLWLLDRLEDAVYWPVTHDPKIQSVSELSDKVSGDQEFLQVAAIYRGREDFDIASLVAELVESESVPFLPSLRYKPSGLRKREVWEKTWELQRKEDAGANVGEIKAPPKYKSADFQKGGYWRLRGKLDVPKERWISYPHCETESDQSLVVGWAGWNHLQQATALIGYYDARKREGWDAKRLTPLLAGLDQLLPWIHQWHPEVDPEFGETAGQSFQTMLEADAHELGLTLDEIRAWEPPKKTTTRRKRTKK